MSDDRRRVSRPGDRGPVLTRLFEVGGVTHMDPVLAAYVLLYRFQSVVSRGAASSFIWCRMVLDDEGNVTPELDLGKLPSMIRAYGDPKGLERAIVRPREEVGELGPWAIVPDAHWDYAYHPEKGRDWLLKQGIALGQYFVMEVSVDYVGTFAEGDMDSEVSSELVYRDLPPGYAFLPVKL